MTFYLKIILVFLLSFFLTLQEGYTQDIYQKKHIKVALRMIGHQVLLQSGDSTTRVLPISKNENQYKIEFDTAFAFVPEDIITIVNQVVTETKLASRYIVEMQDCHTKEIVYSYEVNNLTHSDITPCISRKQPKGCYHLLLTLSDTNLNAAISPINYIAPFLLLVVFLILYLLFFKKKTPKILDTNRVQIGNYTYDKIHTTLWLKEEKIELTSKEADLLLLLHQSANKTIEREVLLNMIWGDEGDYVGRTLDVFISKLRKKLKGDSSIKIVNTRGVGYKLVLDI